MLTSNKITAKEVTLVNMSGYDIFVEVVIAHDHFNWSGITPGTPGPAVYGYNVESSANILTYNNSLYIIIPGYTTIDLYDYMASTYNASLNNSGSFPFGWGSTLNPFYNKVFPYTTVSGADSATSTTPVSLPVPFTTDNLCVKTLKVAYTTYWSPTESYVQHRLTHTSDMPANISEDVGGELFLSKYNHKVLTNWHDASACTEDIFTFNVF